MDQQDIARQDPEAIRHQIDETRSSITEKLEALEGQVVGTVQNARESVEDTIQSARETVQETIDSVKSSVQSVKRTFDVKHQVRLHPWPIMGISFLAGAAGAIWYNQLRQSSPEQEAEYRRPVRPPAPPEPSGPGWSGFFQEEIDKAKGMAVGYLMALGRDWAKQNFPDLAPQIDDFMYGMTEKLGGSPIRQSVLHDAYNQANLREETTPFSRH